MGSFTGNKLTIKKYRTYLNNSKYVFIRKEKSVKKNLFSMIYNCCYAQVRGI